MPNSKNITYGRVTKALVWLILLIISPVFSAYSQSDYLDKLSLSGMVKVDFIYDFESQSGDRINYSSIPIADSNEGNQARIHARESRVKLSYLDYDHEQPLTAVIEGDFYGGGTNSPEGSETISNSVSFRLRHAYVQYDSWLVGQTWSNYVDVSSFPETLDFSNDTGQAFLRQGQLRFQHKFDNLQLSYSIENPETDLRVTDDHIGADTSSKENPESADPMFDLTAKARYQSDWGHLSLQTVVRKLEAYSPQSSESKLGYGIGTSGKLKIDDKQLVKFHYSQGKGIGRYIQEVAGSAGVVVYKQSQPSEFSLNLLDARGGYLAYQYKFSPSLRANISTGFIDIDFASNNETNLFDSNTEKLQSIHGNVIWKLGSSFEAGIEHSFAEVTKVSGETGKIRRLQLSTIYKF